VAVAINKTGVKMSKTEATKAVDYYRNKICVTYINESPFEEGLVEFVEVFKEYKEAEAFAKKKREDKTFVGFINLSFLSDEGIGFWVDLHKGSCVYENEKVSPIMRTH
jgi:hypothetical protein